MTVAPAACVERAHKGPVGAREHRLCLASFRKPLSAVHVDSGAKGGQGGLGPSAVGLEALEV